MKKKLIYISYLPLDKNNYERLGIKTFYKRGWDIEYWLFFKELASVFKENDLFYEKQKNFLIFKSFFQFIKKVKNIQEKNFYFINLCIPWFDLLLQIKGGKKIVLDVFSFPLPKNMTLKKFLIDKITVRKSFSFFVRSIQIISNKIYEKFRAQPSYVFAAGSKSLYISENYKNLNYKKTKVVKCHSLDYERYLEYKNNLPDKNLENAIVFIDQHIEGNNYGALFSPGHVTIQNQQFYWKSLNNFLNNLSSKLGKKVIIAGHPKRNKEGKKFTDYEIIYNQTANLIKNSSCVIGHHSTAVSFVVLFRKPYCTITTDEIMKTTSHYFATKKYSEELGCKLINIDHFTDYNSVDFLKYNEDAYKNYIENYVKTSDVKSKNFWSDFIDYFENEK